MAAYPYVPTVWLQDSRQHAYCCSLTGAVGAEKTKDFPFVDDEGDAVDCFMLVEAFMKILSYKKFFRNMSFPFRLAEAD